MINIPLVEAGIALVLCALIARFFLRGSEKASKAQKGEILKQLLALSETDIRSKPSAPAPRPKPLPNPSARLVAAPRMKSPGLPSARPTK